MNKKLLIAATELHFIHFWIEHINHFRSLGYDVDIVCADCGKRVDELRDLLPEINVRVISSKRSPLSIDNIKAYKQLKEILSDLSYDCIITNEPVMSVLVRLAARKSRKRGTKVIYIAHGFHFFKGNKRINNIIYHTIEENLSRITDVIVTLNTEDFDSARNFKTGIKVYHINSIGYKSYKFAPCLDDNLRLAKRHEFGISDDETVLVFAGELNKNKNQIILLKAIKILKNDGYNVRLILCGKGNQLENLQNYCNENNLNDSVVFLGYYRNANELFPICDIGCSSSIREGLPLNVVEYMASGLPVIASKNRGHTDIVESGKNGFIFDYDSPDQFATYVKQIINNPDLLSEMRVNNIKKAEKYDILKISNNIAKIIKDTLCISDKE